MLVTQSHICPQNTHKHLEYYVQLTLRVTNQRHCGQPELCNSHTCAVDVSCYAVVNLRRGHASAVRICVQFHAIVEDGDDLESRPL